jgi:hypothetical protein
MNVIVSLTMIAEVVAVPVMSNREVLAFGMLVMPAAICPEEETLWGTATKTGNSVGKDNEPQQMGPRLKPRTNQERRRRDRARLMRGEFYCSNYGFATASEVRSTLESTS